MGEWIDPGAFNVDERAEGELGAAGKFDAMDALFEIGVKFDVCINVEEIAWEMHGGFDGKDAETSRNFDGEGIGERCFNVGGAAKGEVDRRMVGRCETKQ